MKNIIIILNLLLAVQLSAQKVKTSGEWLMGENKGKSFVLAPNEYMDLYLGTVEAYNAGDVEREISFYEAAFGAENREFTTNWHASIEKSDKHTGSDFTRKTERVERSYGFNLV